MASPNKKDPSANDLEVLCRHCGRALSEFLHEMEEHNAEVVCPSCGKKHVGKNRAGDDPPGTAPTGKD